MGENKKSRKRRKVDPGASVETEDQELDVSSKITNHFHKKQEDAQREKQKKISEANKLLKREKRKQRVKKQKNETADKPAASQTVKKTSPEYAISYVKQWKEDKDNWKFQTLVQSWILQNLLDDSKISREDFPLVLEYALSVRGSARRRMVDEMRAVVEARDRWPSLRAEGQTREQARQTVGRDKPSKRAYRRARSLLQSLDDDDE